jgi:hypothetical protein
MTLATSAWVAAMSQALVSARAWEGAPAAVMLCQPEKSLVWSVSHERLYASGGARMFCARGSVSMMIMGAPQCWHTNVGAVAWYSLWGECALG